MLTKRTPISGEDNIDTLQRLMTQEPLPPRRLVPSIPRDLEAICLRCLEKQPQRRYASAGALAWAAAPLIWLNAIANRSTSSSESKRLSVARFQNFSIEIDIPKLRLSPGNARREHPA